MKFPYSNPNLRLTDLIRGLLIRENVAEIQIKKYFSDLTGKRYVLLTNSCRTALYLTYKSLGMTGEIITSPLTCKVAIDPIIESGNMPVYADIDPGDLNINPSDIEHRINENTRAIQVIHLGGISCHMDSIIKTALKHRLLVIEDCAQGLGATYKGEFVGSFGYVSCFSLSKNAYGLGGGVLATNSLELFNRVSKINEVLSLTPARLIVFRIIRNLIVTRRTSMSGDFLYRMLLRIKGQRKSYQTIKGQLFHIRPTVIKIAAHQISRFNYLHNKRKSIGELYYNFLCRESILCNNNFNASSSSFTKFFIFNPSINSKNYIENLIRSGFEVMHLEERTGSPCQEPIIKRDEAIKSGLEYYLKVHNCIISLPLCENFDNNGVKSILEHLKFMMRINN